MRGTATRRISVALNGIALLLAIAGAAAIGSCKDSSRAAGTSLFVSVDFPDSLAVTQIRFSARADNGALFDPVIRPAHESGVLATGQSIRILLSDSLDGHSISIGAEGLSAGRAVGADRQIDVKVRKGLEVEVDLLLGGVQSDCGACPGCCSGVSCITNYSLLNCGSDLVCGTCNPVTSDSCAPGQCRCGTSPACAPDAGSDRCSQGQCRCGANDPCQPGQVCIDGQCACTTSSCSNGCCSGATCVPRNGLQTSACGSAGLACDSCNAGQSCTQGVCSDCPAGCPTGCCSGRTCQPEGFNSCGKSGSVCIKCDPLSADACSDGTCSCGAGPACGPGLHCVSGACRCDSVSCPDGCCKNNICETAGTAGRGPAALATCGKGGRSCAACDPVRADTCTSSGVCACGGGLLCDPGQTCMNGSCVCHPATCAGCCSADGLSCRLGSTNAECGRQGFACQACPSSQSCVTSGSPAPDAGGVCSGCTEVSCSFGCCSGSACVVTVPGSCPTDGGICYCGVNGGICRSCSGLTTDTCGTDGNCGCGTSPPCRAGQQCINGLCFCNATSCPSGCCNSGNCEQPSASSCGTSGGGCYACPAQLANNCSSSGECRCGSAPSCDGGQECLSSSCVCDPSSCAGGCCDSNRQCLAPSVANCGALGSSCLPCDPVRSNRCAGGACACGDGGICAAGQQCVSGTCRCTGTSCPSGCCSGNLCRTASTSSCGVDGGACVACLSGAVCPSGNCIGPPLCCLAGDAGCNPCGTAGDHCAAPGNVCLCGTQPACTGGRRCVNQTCVP